MPMLSVLLQIALIIDGVLLVGVILLQRTKGAGAGVTFGGMGESLFGAEVGNVLTRATIVLGSLFIAITLALCILVSRQGATAAGSVMDSVPVAPVATPAPVQQAVPVTPATQSADAEEVVATAFSAAETVPEAPAAEPVAAPEAAPAPAAPAAAPEAK